MLIEYEFFFTEKGYVKSDELISCTDSKYFDVIIKDFEENNVITFLNRFNKCFNKDKKAKTTVTITKGCGHLKRCKCFKKLEPYKKLAGYSPLYFSSNLNACIQILDSDKETNFDINRKNLISKSLTELRNFSKANGKNLYNFLKKHNVCIFFSSFSPDRTRNVVICISLREFQYNSSLNDEVLICMNREIIDEIDNDSNN